MVDTEGDSTFAAFGTAASAVRAAVQAQCGVQTIDGAPPITIRAGLHTGPARPLQGDYLAVPVHIAARVASAAGAGQVFVSGDTLAAVGSPGHAEDFGLYELRDVLEPVRLWRVAGPREAPRASPVRRTNVQPAHTTLVGRANDLDKVSRLLCAHRLVNLIGAGGLGKTRRAGRNGGRLSVGRAQSGVAQCTGTRIVIGMSHAARKPPERPLRHLVADTAQLLARVTQHGQVLSAIRTRPPSVPM